MASLPKLVIAQDGEFVTFLGAHDYRYCNSSYSSDATSVGGQPLDGPFGGFYCISEDATYLKGASPVLDGVISRVGEIGKINRIELSTNFLDGQFFASFLCSLPLEAGASLTVFVQRINPKAADGESHLSDSFFAEIEKCISIVNVRFIGCDFYDGDPDEDDPARKCPDRQTNSQHIKLLVLHGTDGGIYLAGSGNFTTASLTRNIENWVGWVQSPPSGRTVFDCAFVLLDRLAHVPQMSFFQQRAVYNACASFALNLPALDLYVLPFSEQDFRTRLSKEIAASSAVTVVGQFIESEFLFSELAKSPDLQVTFLVDSAYYYANRDGKTFNFVKPSVAKRLFDFVAGRPGTEIRFIQTNHHFAVHAQTNTLHLRSILFEASDRQSMMVGSAHFKDGAWRNNTELQMFLTGETAMQHVALIDQLLARSVSVEQLPQDASVTAIMLGP